MREKLRGKITRFKESYVITSKSKILRILFMLSVILIGCTYLIGAFYSNEVITPTITNKLLGLGIIIGLVTTIVYGSLLLNGQESLKDLQDEGIGLHELGIEQTIDTKKLVKLVKKAIEEMAEDDQCSIVTNPEKEAL